MPAATPVPRGPTVLALYCAADLLTGPGCPVCRYAGEAGDRYLAWFALEAHADPVTITRLCSSLGMCPRHTRSLTSQPGAARRLTAVYRYLVREAGNRLSRQYAQLAACPACEHDDRAAGSALETLLEGLADDHQLRDRYLGLGGLCIPHLRSASVRGANQVTGLLAQGVIAAARISPATASWLAGTDHDAHARAALRQGNRMLPDPGTCVVCLARCRAESEGLAWIAGCGDRDRPDPRLVLCAGHLSDLIVMAGRRDAAPLLTWQTASLVVGLAERSALRRGRDAGSPVGWLRSRRRAARPGGCAVCLHAADAALPARDDLRALLPAARPAPGRQVPLCVRHLLGLMTVDRQAGTCAAPAAAERARTLIAELDEAFGKGTWSHRHDPAGPEMTAWRRAAEFLDGGVFCGGLDGET
jgi:hypothetical protein